MAFCSHVGLRDKISRPFKKVKRMVASFSWPACSSKLSWDGTLCELCRRCFDSIIIDSDNFSSDINTMHRTEMWLSDVYWWHDVETLKRCAGQHCRFCLKLFSQWQESEWRVRDLFAIADS